MDILTRPPHGRIDLRLTHWKEMLADVAGRVSEEACGLVAGLGGISMEVIPLENVLHSPVRYLFNPEEQFEAFKRIGENGWALLAIYHSHLHGPSGPSPTDIAEATYPETVYLIWSRTEDFWDCRGYLILGGLSRSFPVEVIRDIRGD